MSKILVALVVGVIGAMAVLTSVRAQTATPSPSPSPSPTPAAAPQTGFGTAAYQ